jgi:CRISPR-associated protein Cmr6
MTLEGPMHTRRSNIDDRRITFAPYFNPGLWLDKYIAGQNARTEKRNEKEQTFKQQLVRDVATCRPPAEYALLFQRWKTNLQAIGALLKSLQIEGRVVVGLGAEAVLEASVTMHRTYGVPYIPGSALKGLASSYARKELENDEWRKVKDDGNVGILYEAVFGSAGKSGYITFHDALYVPSANNQTQLLHADVMTVHHADYYGGEDPPADWDDPNPVPFLSATGSYLLALSGEPGTDRLLVHTMDILALALRDYGIGAKTSSGYGRATLADPPMTATERQVRNQMLQEERVETLVNEIKTMTGELKEMKTRLRDIANALVKGKLTEAQKKRVAVAICERVEDIDRPIDVSRTEWYPKIREIEKE